MAKLPDYVAMATPNSRENRLSWWKSTASAYAGVMLWFVFWQDIPTAAVGGYAGGMFGFFSSHAANAFGLAVCASQGIAACSNKDWKWFPWVIFIWAALVTVSRIFVGKHYLGDILVGTLVGLVLGYVFSSLAHYLCSKLK